MNGIVTVSNTTQSSSKDTGAIRVEGGAGIEKNLFVGGGAEVTGVTTITGTLDANGALDVDGHTELDDVNVAGASTFAGVLDVNSTSQNQFTTGRGALQVAGGAGIAKNLFVTGAATIVGFTSCRTHIDGHVTTNSSSITTGPTVVDGGY